MGGVWVINPPSSPWLNSSSVHQKPNFKVWGRMVPVRATPLSALGSRNAYWFIFQLVLHLLETYLLFVLVESL